VGRALIILFERRDNRKRGPKPIDEAAEGTGGGKAHPAKEATSNFRRGPRGKKDLDQRGGHEKLLSKKVVPDIRAKLKALRHHSYEGVGSTFRSTFRGGRYKEKAQRKPDRVRNGKTRAKGFYLEEACEEKVLNWIMGL